jgi:hypothetical protein
VHVDVSCASQWRASPQNTAGLLHFVNQLSDAMHAHGKVVSIDAAPCVNPQWEGVKWQNNCMWYGAVLYCMPYCRSQADVRRCTQVGPQGVRQ